MGFFVGIDIGGTTTTIAVGSNQIVRWVSAQFPTDSKSGPKGVLEAIAAQLMRACEQLGLNLQECRAIGLSTPGPATLDGVLLKTPNLTHQEWDQFGIRGALGDRLHQQGFQAPVYYIGDGQAAALGEYAVRSGAWHWDDAHEFVSEPELESLSMVIVGTGLGGGEVRSRSVLRGRQGRAGHAGHIFLPRTAFRYEHDTQLMVGNATSTVESAVSLTGLAHQLAYRLALPEWTKHPLHLQDGTVREKAKCLRELAAAGDALALQLFDDQAYALGIGLLSLNYIGDYELLVIGGGVCDLAAQVRDRYIARAKEAYDSHALDGFRHHVRIEFSVCHDTAPVIGAIAHAKMEQDRQQNY